MIVDPTSTAFPNLVQSSTNVPGDPRAEVVDRTVTNQSEDDQRLFGTRIAEAIDTIRNW
jgi:hypothetical protein